jgi:hypothetical protein
LYVKFGLFVVLTCLVGFSLYRLLSDNADVVLETKEVDHHPLYNYYMNRVHQLAVLVHLELFVVWIYCVESLGGLFVGYYESSGLEHPTIPIVVLNVLGLVLLMFTCYVLLHGLRWLKTWVDTWFLRRNAERRKAQAEVLETIHPSPLPLRKARIGYKQITGSSELIRVVEIDGMTECFLLEDTPENPRESVETKEILQTDSNFYVTKLPASAVMFYDAAFRPIAMGTRVGNCLVTNAHVWMISKVAGRDSAKTLNLENHKVITFKTRNALVDIVIIPLTQSELSVLGAKVPPVRVLQSGGVEVAAGPGICQAVPVKSVGPVKGRALNPLVFLHGCSTHSGFSGAGIYQGGKLVGIHIGGIGKDNCGIVIAPFLPLVPGCVKNEDNYSYSSESVFTRDSEMNDYDRTQGRYDDEDFVVFASGFDDGPRGMRVHRGHHGDWLSQSSEDSVPWNEIPENEAINTSDFHFGALTTRGKIAKRTPGVTRLEKAPVVSNANQTLRVTPPRIVKNESANSVTTPGPTQAKQQSKLLSEFNAMLNEQLSQTTPRRRKQLLKSLRDYLAGPPVKDSRTTA